MNDKAPAASAKESSTGRDWGKTLFLPKTDFPMRAGLPAMEPKMLERWQAIDVYSQLRAASTGRARFTLHDGPPYANGNIHIGHALNKILKDLVTRSQQMLGFDSNYVPGWDCHGLPIEWKIEEDYMAKGKAKPNLKDPVAMKAFRAECRAFAEHWLNVQREEFKRLGVEGDWKHPYSTMTFPAEAQIARELMKFAETGQLYRGSKPVMWSVVEKTALAEAEVEYQDYQSDQVWVKFPIKSVDLRGHNPAGNGLSDFAWTENELEEWIKACSVVIWTTTPWTLPGNRAIAFNSKIKYRAYEVTAAESNKWAAKGQRYVVAETRWDELCERSGITDYYSPGLINPNWILTCSHPLRNAGLPGYQFDVPLLDGDHVTDDTGTGFVHTAPGHGREDFDIWTASTRFLQQRGISPEIPYTVDENGAYTKDAPGFEGERVITDKGEKGKANEAVIKALAAAGMMVARSRLKHQYPHSWRSKKPVIFRNTPQWFIHMDKAVEHLRKVGHRDGVRPRTSNVTDQPSATDVRGLTPIASHNAKKPETLREVSLQSIRETGDGVRPRTSNVTDQPSATDVRGLTPIASHNAKKPETLREVSLQSIRETEWVPASGENRIRGMIEAKPDWVISRQRAWGVPITVFVKKGTNDYLVDPEVNQRIYDAMYAEGADAWFADADGARFLKGPTKKAPQGYNPADYEKINDVLDVWFDSGSTHTYVLEDAKHFPGLAGFRRIVDGGRDRVMYLEGSDQHRGWFHSSLIESSGTRGRAPFDVVLTHGFTMDEKGQKMSKSVGNVVAPQDVMKKYGADILRLWVAGSDYADDQRLGNNILDSFADAYRKTRNTMRWMLGTLAHYDPKQAARVEEMPELERLMLHRLAELDGVIRKAYAEYEYAKVVTALSQFMNTELSAFYFDIRKDALYCEAPSSNKRHAALTCVEHIFRCTTIWLAPILAFTADEAWLERYPHKKAGKGSVHLEVFPDIPATWRDDKLAEKWEKVRRVRSVVTGALEIERAAKRIGSSLEAAPLVYVSDKALAEAIEGVDLAEVCITSGIAWTVDDVPAGAFTIPEVKGVAVVPARATGTKCARSWRYTTDVGADPAYPELSARDAAAMREIDGRAA